MSALIEWVAPSLEQDVCRRTRLTVFTRLVCSSCTYVCCGPAGEDVFLAEGEDS